MNSSSLSHTTQAPAANTDTGLAESEYAEKARRLIELANDLKALGATHILDIPRVVFIGNQSAGKSSVVEGVTGIKVPRDGGTCTRCPMECTVKRTEGPWSCTISLRLDYLDGKPIEGTSTTIAFATVSTPAEVELWLRRAQAAILSPVQPVTDALVAPYKKKTAEELKTIQREELLPFSYNTVVIDIEDRCGTDLSFVDLPGIIHNHETDPSMTSLVMRLVQNNIKGKNTLIVVTLPMTDDIQTQQAVAIARKVDPSGYRTIGVATKPDTLSAGDLGSLEAWKQTLQGDIHTLRHGYFAVKLPNDATRAAGHSTEELQDQEKQFFESTDPWRGMSDRSRFGIPNFITSTSRLLVNLIEKNLPSLKKDVDALLTAALEEQKKLPPLHDAHLPPLTIALSRITQFCKIFEQTVEGSVNKSFTHKNQALYEQFKLKVDRTAPAFDVTRGPREYLPNDPPSSEITMEDVRTAIRENKSWEFPNHVPFEATNVFLDRHISQWKDPANECFRGVAANLSRFIDKLLIEAELFDRFTMLKRWVREIISLEEATCVAETSDMIDKLFSFEKRPPYYFLNKTGFDTMRNQWFQLHIRPPRSGDYTRVDEHEVMASVHAYLQIASQRFVDQIPLAIENMLHHALAKRVMEKLMEAAVGLDGVDKLKEMLKEDPQIAEARERLRQRVERLKAIKERLLEFERGSSFVHASAEEEEDNTCDDDFVEAEEEEEEEEEVELGRDSDSTASVNDSETREPSRWAPIQHEAL